MMIRQNIFGILMFVLVPPLKQLATGGCLIISTDETARHEARPLTGDRFQY